MICCPSDAPGPHITGDVTPYLQEPWDLVIAHPPCTRLCNSGVRWLHERDLWTEMRTAAEFFKACLDANAARVAVENPVMHRYARDIVGRGPDFTIQPWQFGHPEVKRTCFHTRGLPPLKPAHVVSGRYPRRSIVSRPGLIDGNVAASHIAAWRMQWPIQWGNELAMELKLPPGDPDLVEVLRGGGETPADTGREARADGIVRLWRAWDLSQSCRVTRSAEWSTSSACGGSRQMAEWVSDRDD